jgi:hypothetical protein
MSDKILRKKILAGLEIQMLTMQERMSLSNRWEHPAIKEKTCQARKIQRHPELLLRPPAAA